MHAIQQQAQSEQLFNAAKLVMPGGVNSPVRAFGSVGGNPRFLRRAQGAYVYDVDGCRYVDLVGSWGPAIAGHAHPQVIKAVSDTAADGISFGACCPLETQLAEIIVDALPSIEMVRFVNSGTEATMSALRLARAATGRTKTLKFLGGYHGHVDSLLVAAGSGATTFGSPDSAGVPKAFADTTLLAPYNDLQAVSQVLDQQGTDVAAIIVEPIAGNMGYVEPRDDFLLGLRSICDKHGSLLIFDEVMTGFRTAWGGYQNICGVRPDLTCLGKVIGGGMPVAAYAGSAKLMKQVSPLGQVYQAGTLSGNPVGMAAGISTLGLCREPGFYESLAGKSKRLTEGLADAANQAGIAVQTGYTGGMVGLAFSTKRVCNFDDAKACNHELFARFFHAMLDLGVWLPPSSFEALFVSAAHDDDAIDAVLVAASKSFAKVSS